MTSTSPPPAQILILGAGVFGLSTALSLLTRPSFCAAHITLLDASPTLPNPAGSSVDASRIVRADYACLPYAKLALAAQSRWRDRSDGAWGGQGRYTEPGFLLSADRGKEEYLRLSLQNVRALAAGQGEFEGLGGGLRPEQIEELVGQKEILRASGYGGVSGDSGYVNWGSGWADAEACVRYALDRVRVEGAGRVSLRSGARVRRLLYRKSETGEATCVGAELEDGEKVHADLVIVAAGAWSPTLVNLQGRAVATGQALAYLDISEVEQEAMQDRPTIMNMSRGMFIIPPRGRELKIARHGFGYRNPRRIADPDLDVDTGEQLTNGHSEDSDTIEVSIPAVGTEIPLEAQEACREALHILVPEMATRPFSRTRICWYCDTPDGDFLITHHPTRKNLVLATGGSGHGFKFFPVIGEKIVDAIEGKLDPDLQHMWRWKAEPAVNFTCTEDGSRSGPRGMILEEELRRGKA